MRMATGIILLITAFLIDFHPPIPAASSSGEALSNADFVSAWSVFPVQFDGKVSNDFEWSDANAP